MEPFVQKDSILLIIRRKMRSNQQKKIYIHLTLLGAFFAAALFTIMTTMNHNNNDNNILTYDTTPKEHSNNGLITGKTEVALQLLAENERYRRISPAAHNPSRQELGLDLGLDLGLGGLAGGLGLGDTLVPVLLQTASNYAILSNTGTSSINPGALTGFGLQKDISGTFATSDLVTGRVYAADYAIPTPATLAVAVSAMLAAYLDAAI
eukprot:scaffold4012_cov163-Chaetoceros_neogracile.AAC.2